MNTSGTITLVETQQKRRDRVNVYVDDRFAFSLSNVVAQAAWLRRGLSVSESEIQALLERDSFQKAFDTALNFLSYRPRSEEEVRQNLRRKKVPDELSNRIVERLKETKLIDDSAFAEFWLQNREEFSPRGQRALKMELRRKGLDSETIDRAAGDKGDESESAYRAAAKKAARLRAADYRDFRQKLGAFLMRRGFDYEVINGVVNRLWQELQSEGVEG